MEKLDEKKILKQYVDYHTKRFQEHGFDAKAVWNRLESQKLRFDVLARLFGSNKKFSVLDIGCGLADFYKYLIDSGYDNVIYYGCDVNALFIEEAKKKYPAANLFTGSFNEIHALGKNFDYAIGCGIHAFGESQESVQQYFIENFKKLFTILNYGFGVNFLSVYSKNPDSLSVYHDPAKVLKAAKEHFEKVSLFHNYLPNDFTVLVEK